MSTRTLLAPATPKTPSTEEAEGAGAGAGTGTGTTRGAGAGTGAGAGAELRLLVTVSLMKGVNWAMIRATKSSSLLLGGAGAGVGAGVGAGLTGLTFKKYILGGILTTKWQIF